VKILELNGQAHFLLCSSAAPAEHFPRSRLARCGAFRRGPFDHLVVAEVSMDLTGFQFSDLLHPQTRGFDSENALIEFVILHLRNFRIPPTGGADPLRSRNALIYFHH
jgi:hypothetical protein